MKYEKMAYNAEKNRFINENKYSLEDQIKAFNDFIEACDRVTTILQDDELYEKECQDWLNKTGKYAGK